jgi:uncharacterized protein (DUF433 family)
MNRGANVKRARWFHGVIYVNRITQPSTPVLPWRRTSACATVLTVVVVAERITVNPEQCGGRPCVRGMRIRVSDVLDLLASGLSPQQVLEELPDLEADDIAACLRFASRRVDHPIIAA